MNDTELEASDSLRSSVSSPGMPNTYFTPSASRHSTKTSEALLAAIGRRPYQPERLRNSGGYLRLSLVMRRSAHAAFAVAAALVACAPAQAASNFTIKGAGYGHGVGMSQFGALGFAQHGADYREILGHYYANTAIGTAPGGTIVRVLLAAP